MNKRQSTIKKIVGRMFLIVLLLVLIAGGFWAKLRWFQKEFIFAGTLEATKVDVSARLASTISDISVREGDHVSIEQELARLSCEDLRITSKLANENYDRSLNLFRSGTASKEALDQAENRKDDIDLKLTWCSVVSPIQGTVLSRYHEPGEWVGPGVKLLTLANMKEITAYIYVPHEDVAHLKLGEKLTGIVPEMGNREFVGTIVKISSEAEFTPKNVQTQSERSRLVYGVKLSYLGANEDEILKPGMTIEVQLRKSPNKD